ncbi:hypothetical protein GTH32_15675 [Alteromonas sp. 345S023]|uniref:OmpR/PhoB-type domain-containing protein n=1 Tax=Alteromonas profundi TaxID=2696062 RepID=A0A7X5LPB1_9ALTE|nr:PD40 domain-containing protein [Alteromonas profundi]NDV92614.1 hypothetical protein [Alteromonas profundi]
MGDEAKNPRYIQTVPKRGYRLVCQVSPPHGNTPNHANTTHRTAPTIDIPHRRNSRFSHVYKYVGAIVLLVVIGGIFWQQIALKSNLSMGYSAPLTRAKGIEYSPRIHPDNIHVYYLSEIEGSNQPELRVINKDTASVRRVKLSGHISTIIKVMKKHTGMPTQLIYLSTSHSECSVYQAALSNPQEDEQSVKSVTKLFDCKHKRIKDVDYHEQQHAIYYTAQPENFWPNQVYAFDIASKKTITPTQPEPKGWGHHSIDISPDGETLLIMSTDHDYYTQLYAVNLSTQEITEGAKFSRPVDEAIWHHDSEHIYYHSPPPSYQILQSDLYGENTQAIIGVSEELSSEMTRMADGKNVLFSTEQSNYNNRWLVGEEDFTAISNSTVSDISPIMFHHSEQYVFASKRSGHMQLYLGSYRSKEVVTLTKFHARYTIGHMAMSFDDNALLLSVNNKVYHLPMRELLEASPLTDFNEKHLIYVSEFPIISLDWFGIDNAAITTVNHGTPTLTVTNLLGQELELPNGNWAYGLTDSEYPTDIYIIKQKSNALHYIGKKEELDDGLASSATSLKSLLNLPEQFYHAKVDARTLYYITTENDVEFLHSVPLTGAGKTTKLPLYRFSNYDVTRGKIIVSDMADREGDIYRTVQ